MHGFILRYVTQEILGIANVRLQLLYTTTVFISRECFRKTCLDSKNTPYNEINNLSFLSIPVGLIFTVFLSLVWIYILPQPENELYVYNVVLFGIATMLEILSEPLYIFCQVYMYVGIKVYYIYLNRDY